MSDEERTILIAALDFLMIVGGVSGLVGVAIIAMALPSRCRMPDPPEPWRPSTPYLTEIFNPSKGTGH